MCIRDRGEPDEQPEERHGRHGVAGRKAKAADLDQTQGDIGAGAVSYTHLDVYKRQVDLGTVFSMMGMMRR